MSGVPKRKSKARKSGAKETRERLDSKIKGILPQSLRGSTTRRQGSTASTRKQGSHVVKGGNKEPLEPGVPKPQALSGGVGARASKARNVRNRAGSLTSVSSEKSKVQESIIHTGYLKKKGVVNVAWKNRFFLLTNKSIYYYEKDPGVPNILEEVAAKGKIPLSEIEAIDKDVSSKDKKKKDPVRFHINTPSRIYKLQAYNDENDTKKAAQETDGWIGAISGAMANYKQTYYNHARRESSASQLEWIKDHEKSITENINISIGGASTSSKGPMVGPNEPARLANWLGWSAFDVAAWLYKVDLKQVYSEAFYENEVDGKKLSEITRGDLKGIGVDDEEDQMKILNAIEQLKTSDDL